MSHSLNEVEALCKRAARGAGLSWGLAEEAGAAARWLAGFGLPGPDVLAALLKDNDHRPASELAPVALRGRWHAASGRLCPLMAGAALSDCAARLETGEVFEMEQVDRPLLLVPFAAGAALRLACTVVLDWSGIRLVTDGRQLGPVGEGDRMLDEYVAALHCRIGGELTRPLAEVQRVQVGAECWAQLSAFAHRTYAPATEASRLSGAGAGLSDDD